MAYEKNIEIYKVIENFEPEKENPENPIDKIPEKPIEEPQTEPEMGEKPTEEPGTTPPAEIVTPPVEDTSKLPSTCK